LRDLQARGERADLELVIRDIERRDHQDRTRAVSPLRPADGAVVVDTTALSIDQVIDRLVQLAHTAATKL
jgi:cytidylate kinase